jgi:hypothetical protein
LKIAHGSRTGGTPLKAIDERASALPEHFTPPPHPVALARVEYARLIDRLTEKSSEIRKLQGREKKAPHSSWFGDTKSSVRNELSASFDSVQEVLLSDMLYDYAGQFEKQSENLRMALTAEPGISGSHSGGGQADDGKARIVKIKIETYEQNISIIIQSIQSKFGAMGIELPESQILILLERIDFRDILRNVELYNIINSVMINMASSMTNNVNHNETERAYRDVHLLLWETINDNQMKYISRIRQVYMPRVQKAIAQADAETDATNRLLLADPAVPQKGELEDALRANSRTRKMAISYAALLKDQAARIASANRGVGETLSGALAVSASLDTGADLVRQIDRSRRKLELFAGMQAPVIEPFESDQEAHIFTDLTVRMRGMD